MPKNKFFHILILTFLPFHAFLQFDEIHLKEIMKGDEFVGNLAFNQQWHLSGNSFIYEKKVENEIKTFRYYLQKNISTEVQRENIYDQLPFDERKQKSKTHYFIHEGMLYALKNGTSNIKPIYKTKQFLTNLQRTNKESVIAFQTGINLYEYDQIEGSIIQLTDFINDNKKEERKDSSLLDKQQKYLFKYLNKEIETTNPTNSSSFPKKQYLGKGQISNLQISLDREIVALRVTEYSKKINTNVTHYVTSDGYTKSNKARAKVSDKEPNQKLAIYNILEDSLHWIDFSKLKNIRKKPSYLSEYEENTSVDKVYKIDRSIFIHQLHFNEFNSNALIDIRASDNKDRWIVVLNTNTLEWKEIDYQHDDAWIGGPGISGWNMVDGTIGWFNKAESCYFQSEKSGYSHLYAYDFNNQKKCALTKGKWEVYKVLLSADQKTFYITCNKSHPGNRDFYHLEINTKKLTPILTSDGYHDVSVSPDEKSLLVRYSYKNKPWELYIAKNKTSASLQQITDYTSSSFKSIKWQDPELITFNAIDGNKIYARLYAPADEKKNNAAIIFVHGAGYLQNAHNYWSSYFREYMFHNLLLKDGYTILDIDFRASEGYGRDHRTAIYRNMGGKDLSDQLDGKRYLIQKHNISKDKIGIYGGSYGGFITLMALLKNPGEFACGAALRSVTDWMHYNHEYTSNILNYPNTDSIAYYRSSPINFAENLQDPLLMLHGMEDSNVQFQDVIRLSQRFIELEKTDWELSVFPVEGHSFKESYSWHDEYRRIYELFNKHLLEKK